MWSANALFVNYKTVHSWDRGREKKENTLSFSPNSKTQKQSTFEKEKERSALHCCSISTTTFGDCSRFRYASLRGGHQKRREEEMIRRESFEGKTPERQNGTTKKRWSRRRKSWPKTQDDGCRHIHADGRGRDRLFGWVLVSSIPFPLSFSWFATLATVSHFKTMDIKTKRKLKKKMQLQSSQIGGNFPLLSLSSTRHFQIGSPSLPATFSCNFVAAFLRLGSRKQQQKFCCKSNQ